MSFTTLFFDLDDTLYASNNGLWGEIGERMSQYMVEVLGLPKAEVPAIRRSYYETYGTTLRGLQIHHQVDADDFLNYVHDLPLEQYLQPDPALRSMLLSLPQSRWIFTNADSAHASRVMKVLGVDGCFDGIIDIRALEFACKPEPVAYRRALALAGDPEPEQCLLVDDSVANLAGARQLGLSTLWISRNGSQDPAAHYTLANLKDLPTKLPCLWSSHGGDPAGTLSRN